MTPRERFHRTFEFDSPDRVPYWELLGYWGDTIDRWREEGMPGDVHFDTFFGFDRREGLPVGLGFAPAFKAEVLRVEDGYEIVQGGDGVVYRRMVRDQQSIPQYVSFPVQNRDDFEKLKKRLNPKSPSRYPRYWRTDKKVYEGRDYPLFIGAGSLYGWPRNWMGVENLSYAFYDDPGLVHEMMEYITEFIIEAITPMLEDIPEIDCATIWEDMAYKSGSLISPKHFKEFMVPRYQRITNHLRKYGIHHIWVDCDGNHDELNPLWLEGGLTGVYPLEVAAGEDPVALRKKYGKDLELVGGLDKRVLARTKRDIEEEVHAKLPFLLEQGGYAPSVDHGVPPDVPYQNYLYFLEVVRKIVEKG